MFFDKIRAIVHILMSRHWYVGTEGKKYFHYWGYIDDEFASDIKSDILNACCEFKNMRCSAIEERD